MLISSRKLQRNVSINFGMIAKDKQGNDGVRWIGDKLYEMFVWILFEYCKGFVWILYAQ